jgi:predicted TIM-barrel fold metal-dependent hydrolase
MLLVRGRHVGVMRMGASTGTTDTTSSARVHDQLRHPVIDGDGHWLEPVPIFCDFLRDEGGGAMVDRYLAMMHEAFGRWYDLTPEERLAERRIRPPWLGEAPRTIDRATAMLPKLLYERLDEFGLDFAVIYTTLGLFAGSIPDEDLRRAYARAVNVMNAEMFAPYADRMTPVAVIPAVNPEEAVDELVHARQTLGMKCMVVTAPVRRPVDAVRGNVIPVGSFYVDALFDGPYDYDPLWAKAAELQVAVTTHTGGVGWPDRNSPTNFVYNHVGHFAAGAHAICKGVFLAGVTRRFPTLNFAFQEGGAAWAAALYLDLISHWRKRNIDAMKELMQRAPGEATFFAELIERYGGERTKGRAAEMAASPTTFFPNKSFDDLIGQVRAEEGLMGIDDFAALAVRDEEDLKSLFRDRFYFGCEADDVTASLAFDKRLGLGLRAVFSSDIGHFDVPDMTEVLHEAFELVDDGLLDEDDFESFTFTNAARLHAGVNPSFFEGTVVEAAVAELGIGVR